MNAAEIANALGHAEHRGRKWRCDCPLHGGHSLELSDGDVDLLVTCWGGCDTKAVLAELRQRGLLDNRRDDDAHRRHRAVLNRNSKQSDEAHRIKTARAIWASGVPITGTGAQSYLRARGLLIEDNPSLRFIAAFEYAPGAILPAMAAAFATPMKKIVGVQVTMLNPDGLRKAAVTTPRRTYGVLRDGAVRLARVGDEIGLAEGTETALSATAIFGVPCWAVLGAKRLDHVALPDGVSKVIIYSDNDEAGRDAAERSLKAYARSDRHVRIQSPRAGFKDWNDFLTLRRGECAA